jgi:aspartyl-tRNA synthetase
MILHKYRTHTCNELTLQNKNEEIVLSGWVNKKRDHGNLLFIDLRDNFGLTQCVIDNTNKYFNELEKLQLETVVKIQGTVVERAKDTINADLSTGKIEVNINSFEILGCCRVLPMPVFTDQVFSEVISRSDSCFDVRS